MPSFHSKTDRRTCAPERCDRSLGLAVALSSLAAASCVEAQPQQAYPNRPIRMIAAQAAGAGTDIAARLFAQKLADALGQQVVVDNRPGAGGVIGTDLTAKAAPDGYTMLMAAITQTMLPAIYKKLPYDPIKDFAPVSLLVAYPFLLIVHPSVPARTVNEFIALAKVKPGQLNYASSGNGASAHLATELFKSMAGINIVHVPYKGIAAAIIATVSNEANLGFYSVSATYQHVKAERLRALASSGPKRSAAFPELPTIGEAGVPGYEVVTWAGILAPSGTPRPIVARLHRELVRILQLADVKERLSAIDFEPVGNTPEEFDAFMRKEVARWSQVVRDARIKAD